MICLFVDIYYMTWYFCRSRRVASLSLFLSIDQLLLLLIFAVIVIVTIKSYTLYILKSLDI